MHQINLIDPTRQIDQDSLQDFIDLLYGGRPSLFTIHVVPSLQVGKSGVRGQHYVKDGIHNIDIFCAGIQQSMSARQPVGGNTTVASDLRHGVYLVLAHELRHGYQALIHGRGMVEIIKGKYLGRPAEIDARRHVDEHADAILAFLG